MAKVRTFYVDIRTRTAKFEAGMKSARRTMARFTKSAGRMVKGLASFHPVLAGVAGGAALGAFTAKSFAAMDATAKMADRIGIATEKLAGLRHAAEQTGVSAGTLDMSLQRMTRRVSEAANGTGEAVAALQELGLNAGALEAMRPDEQFKAIADAMGQVGSRSDQVRLAMKLFDSEGVALVNTLDLGAAGLDRMQAEAERLGLAMSRVDHAQIEAANDAVDRMQKAFSGVFNRIAIDLAPAITVLSDLILGTGDKADAAGKKATSTLGPISKAIAWIADTIQSVRFGFAKLWEGIFKAVGWIAEKADLIISKVEAAINRIPGISVELSKLSLNDEIADFAKIGEKYWAGVAKAIGESPTFESKILQRQRQIAADAARRAAAGAGQGTPAAVLEEERGRLLDFGGLASSVLSAVGERAAAVADRVAGAGAMIRGALERAAEEPAAGGFRVVDSLRNVAVTGGASAKDRPANQETQAEVATLLRAMLSKLESGEFRTVITGAAV
jgi:hypothetical protein